MSISFQVSKRDANRLATARYDRGQDVHEKADWLDWAATQFRLAMTLQVPVGFEDETGFHCGEPQVQEMPLLVADTSNVFVNANQF